jgi:hypothetical protein
MFVVDFPCCLTKISNDLNLDSVDSVGYQWISDVRLRVDEVLDNCECIPASTWQSYGVFRMLIPRIFRMKSLNTVLPS